MSSIVRKPEVSREMTGELALGQSYGLELLKRRTNPRAIRALTGEVVSGGVANDALLREVQHLRERLALSEDLRTDLPYLLGFYDEDRRRPTIVSLRDAHGLCAVVVFSELRFLGLTTGIYLAGDLVGDGAIIGDPADANQYMEAAVRVLLEERRSAHTVRVCVGASDPKWTLDEIEETAVTVRSRSTRRRLRLASTFPDMLSSFGKHTRRHLTRKRVLLEAREDTRFLPSLDPIEAFRSMVGLGDLSYPRRTMRQKYERYQILSAHEHAFAMGLQHVSGEWLSLVAGWRSGKRTYIDMQMNNFSFAKDSISAVMRSYMLEHEIRIGQTDVVFVGGCSILLQRYCEEDESCVDLLFRRRDLRSPLVERVARRTIPNEAVAYIYQCDSEEVSPEVGEAMDRG